MKRNILLLAGCAMISMTGYLLASNFSYGIGFPLDDAWIHQTYARNLATYGEFAYRPGEVSAGSTAPLWTFLLAVGHLIFRSPYLWTYVLGWLALTALAVAGENWFKHSTGMNKKQFPWIGLFIILEWHLVWASVSGMETLLFAFLVLLISLLFMFDRPRWWLVGLLIGVSTWVRPDGLTMLGPAMLVLIMLPVPKMIKAKFAFQCLVGFLIPVLFYFWFNFALSNGQILPNTFAAKSNEYAALLSEPILSRFMRLARLGLIGPGLFLLPGFVFAIVLSIRNKKFPVLAAGIWWIGYILVYAIRLPVEYQHGRYLMAGMPVYFVTGLFGSSLLLRSRFWQTRTGYILSRSGVLAFILVTLGFYFIGASGYATDVSIIESEMVKTAKWIDQKIPADARLAVHDIGAIGYFTNHEILDLAGLISPEVIPIIRDEDRLARFIQEKNASYLVTMKDWYPELEKGLEMVYQTGSPFSIDAGGTNMVIYRLK